MLAFLTKSLTFTAALLALGAVGVRWGLGPGWGPDDIPSLHGKVALITGANSGLGFATAEHLARAGCRVILACRSAERCDQAVADIRKSVPSAELSAMVVDLSEPDSVQEFAHGILETANRLDFLINNAGIMALPETRNSRGWELQFATNHLGHYALVQHLLPLLKTNLTRIVNHASSFSHLMWPVNPVDLNDLMFERGRAYNPWMAYAQTKRVNLWFTFELNRRYGAHGITATACHPGWTATGLQGKASGSFFPSIADVVNNLAMPPSLGSLPQVYAAVSAAPDEYVGPRFWMRGSPVVMGTSLHVIPYPADDPALARELWERSARITGLDSP